MAPLHSCMALHLLRLDCCCMTWVTGICLKPSLRVIMSEPMANLSCPNLCQECCQHCGRSPDQASRHAIILALDSMSGGLVLDVAIKQYILWMLMKCTDISAALHACAQTMEQDQQHPWQWWMTAPCSCKLVWCTCADILASASSSRLCRSVHMQRERVCMQGWLSPGMTRSQQARLTDTSATTCHSLSCSTLEACDMRTRHTRSTAGTVQHCTNRL